MFNPFVEQETDAADAELVDQAKSGDRGALEKLVLRHQAWIYNIAIRMVFHPQDAEDATTSGAFINAFRRRRRRAVCGR
jgi:DNA-directed RNA polymerase specialized sigma24 family protein